MKTRKVNFRPPTDLGAVEVNCGAVQLYMWMPGGPETSKKKWTTVQCILGKHNQNKHSTLAIVGEMAHCLLPSTEHNYNH